MNEEERIREEVIKAIKKNNMAEWTADQILSIKGIRIEADNQDLPNLPAKPSLAENRGIGKKIEVIVPHHWDEEALLNYIGRVAQQDMLTPKDGKVWKRVVEK